MLTQSHQQPVHRQEVSVLSCSRRVISKKILCNNTETRPSGCVFSFRVVVGGDGGRIPRPSATPLKGGHAGWKNRLGEKRLRPTYAGVSAERQTLRLRTTTAMRTTAPRRAREPDPPDRTRGTRYEGARAGVPFAAAHPKRQAPVWPLRAEVATMRGRNKMRFSAPTREPPGGRPSRGAKLKGRGDPR